MAANNSFQAISDLASLAFIRPTQLATFAACPRELQAVLLGEHPRKESRAAAVGTACHAVIEEFLGDGFDLETDWAEVEGLLIRCGMPPGEREALQIYLEKIAPWRGSVLAIEDEFTLPVPGRAGPPIRGHIDLVLSHADGGLTIVDHKTNRTAAPVAWWQEQFQPRAYAWAARQLWPLCQPIRFRIGYVLLGVFREWEVTPDMDATVPAVYQEFVQALARGEFAERLHDGCKWCARANVCATMIASVRRFFGAIMEE